MSLYEGTFIPEGGTPFSVEVPLSGNGPADKAALVAKARKLHPKATLRLASTRIFSRATEATESFPVGTTLGGLFGEQGSPTETGLEIGDTFFGGERCQVILVNLRSRNSVCINLRPPGGGKVAFSNQLQANLLAKDLKSIVKEVLGDGARELVISLKVSG